MVPKPDAQVSSERVTISLASESLDLVDAAAARIGVTRREYCRQAVMAYLKVHDRVVDTSTLDDIYTDPDDSMLDPLLDEAQAFSVLN